MSDLKEYQEIRNALEIIKDTCGVNECNNSCPFYKRNVCQIRSVAPVDWEISDIENWKVFD